MTRFKVAVTDYVFPDLEPEKEVLAPLEAEVVSAQSSSPEEAMAVAAGADALLNTYYGPVDGRLMDVMPECRIIVRYGIGVDTIDIPAATARGIMVANVPDYCVEEVSDQALAMSLSLLRRLPLADSRLRSGEWALAGLKPLHRLNTLTCGIIGLGRIGRAIAAKVAAIGLEVIAFDPYLTEAAANLRLVALPDLLRLSDVIIVQAPASPETRHILNDEAFALMEKCPVVVNCARGELIDTEALVRAMKAGLIAGAGLDVVEGTPPLGADSPLLDLPNLILTPHSAWLSDEALQSLQRLAAMEVARALQGDRPKSLLNPEVLEGQVRKG